MAQIRSTIKLELENSKLSWLDMFRTPGMRRRVLIAAFLGLFTQMSGNTLLSYYQNLLFQLMGYTTTFAKTRINIANQCWGLLNAVVIALVVTRFPRRKMFMLSAGSMVVVFMAMTICFQRLQLAKAGGYKNQSAQIASLIFYFAYSPTYNIGNNSLTYTYLVELFPYAQRSMGIGIEQIFGKLAGFFSVYVNPIALDAIEWKYLAIYCAWLTFEFTFVYFMYPETHNRTLEELAFCECYVTSVRRRMMLISKQCSRTRPSPMRLLKPSKSRSTRHIIQSIRSTKRLRVPQLSALCEEMGYVRYFAVTRVFSHRRQQLNYSSAGKRASSNSRNRYTRTNISRRIVNTRSMRPILESHNIPSLLRRVLPNRPPDVALAQAIEFQRQPYRLTSRWFALRNAVLNQPCG